MKRDDLLVKLNIYKKEIYRRAYTILFAAFLPLVLVFIGMGIYGGIAESGPWAIVGYFAAFILVMVLEIWWFVKMVNTGIPKKIGLLCPKCNTPIIKNNVHEFMETGVCGKCGEKILED